MSRLEDDLRQVLPTTDVNGDTITLVARKDVFRLLQGLIWPIHRRYFTDYEHLGGDNQDMRMSADEEMVAGRARITADLNTDAGRDAFLECWWPKHADGACIAWTAPIGKEAELPYSVSTQLRSAGITLKLSPTLVISTMRFGVVTVTTTRGRALWDLGIRREVWHPTPGFLDYLTKHQATGRLTPMADGDPNRIWAYRPGTPAAPQVRSFYLERPDRPITDSAMEWLRGAP